MGKVDEIKELLDLEKYKEELEKRKAELEAELDDVKESLGEAVTGIKGWLSKNVKTIGISAFLFVIGFSMGVALV